MTTTYLKNTQKKMTKYTVCIARERERDRQAKKQFVLSTNTRNFFFHHHEELLKQRKKRNNNNKRENEQVV